MLVSTPVCTRLEPQSRDTAPNTYSSSPRRTITNQQREMKHLPHPTRPYNPYLRILLVFSAWKLVLLGLALLTPSPPYDTSTSLILGSSQTGSGWSLLVRLCKKLTRWDAIYFVKVAERGYVNEQEWAFGWGFVKAVSGVEQGFFPTSSVPEIGN